MFSEKEFAREKAALIYAATTCIRKAIKEGDSRAQVPLGSSWAPEVVRTCAEDLQQNGYNVKIIRYRIGTIFTIIF